MPPTGMARGADMGVLLASDPMLDLDLVARSSALPNQAAEQGVEDRRAVGVGVKRMRVAKQVANQTQQHAVDRARGLARVDARVQLAMALGFVQQAFEDVDHL